MGTLQKASFALARAIQQSPKCTSVRVFLRKAAGAQCTEWADLAPVGRNARVQFLGFLLAQQQKEKFIKAPSAAGFPADDLAMIEQCHDFLVWVDQQLVGELARILPNASQVISPYSDYAYSPTRPSEPWFRPPVMDELSKAFAEHPGLRSVKNAVQAMQVHGVDPFRIPATDWHKLLISLERDVIQRGNYEWVRRAFETADRPRPETSLIRLGLALLSLRCSVRTINQLLHQALREDKLVTFNEGNISAVRKRTHNLLGELINIQVQPVGAEPCTDVGELIYLDSPDPQALPSGLAVVSDFTFHMSQEYGRFMDFRVRPVDEWMNPYPGLGTMQ